MAWLTKVSEMAGKAEQMLNKLDQTTGDVVHHHKVRSTTPKPSRSTSFTQLRQDDATLHTEEIGKTGPSLPSRTHSEYAGGIPTGRRKINESFAPSTSVVMERNNFDESLLSILNDDSISVVNESEARSRRSSGHSVISVRTTQSCVSEQPEVQNYKSQIFAKESQIASLKNRLNEIERKLEKRSQDFYELKAEKDMLEQRAASHANTDTLEELKLARKKAQQQNDLLMDDCNQAKRRTAALEDDVKGLSDELRLAKFNLNENKREFDEYKEKAQKILLAKERLVDSLKNEQGLTSGERPGHLLQAEMEEMKVERDLARADLESAQLQLYNLRSDMEELENQLREDQNSQSEMRRQQMEERHSWQSTVNLLNEKIECHRIETEFSKQEMLRQREDLRKQLDRKEQELRRTIEENRSRRREEENRLDHAGLTNGEKMIEKQMQLETALRDNHILKLRLEKLQKSSKDTVIQMESPSSTLSVQHPTARKALGIVDWISFKLISTLRNYPSARVFLITYFVILHLWVFFIVLTYTPEMHDGNGASKPTHAH